MGWHLQEAAVVAQTLGELPAELGWAVWGAALQPSHASLFGSSCLHAVAISFGANMVKVWFCPQYS